MPTRLLACLTVGCFLGAGMLYGFSLRAYSPAPVASLATPAPVDLGAVDQGRTCPFTFRVKNTANRPVTVAKLIPTCGCTWLDNVEGRRIDPGDVLSIRGTLDSEDRRGRTESHAVLTYALADAPGPARSLMLTVRADVRPAVRAVPEPITFHPAAAGEAEMVGSVMLDSERFESFTLIDAMPSVPWITVEVVQREFRKDGIEAQPAELRVTVNPAGLAPRWDGKPPKEESVRIRVKALSVSTLTIPIRFGQP